MTAAEISAIVAIVVALFGAIAGGAYKFIQWITAILADSQQRANAQTKSMLEWQRQESEANRAANAELMRELQANWLNQSVEVMREVIKITDETRSEVANVRHDLALHNTRVDGIVSDLQDIRRATTGAGGSRGGGSLR